MDDEALGKPTHRRAGNVVKASSRDLRVQLTLLHHRVGTRLLLKDVESRVRRPRVRPHGPGALSGRPPHNVRPL